MICSDFIYRSKNVFNQFKMYMFLTLYKI